MASSKIVVGAIDFGTTFSGYAFSFANDYERDPLKIQTNHWIGGGHISLKVFVLMFIACSLFKYVLVMNLTRPFA